MTLKDWLAREAISEAAFAASIGCAPSTINRLCRERITPSRTLLRAIAERTDYAVGPNDFFPEAVSRGSSEAAA